MHIFRPHPTLSYGQPHSLKCTRGTAVRGIALVPDNPAHIEGRVEGQRIVILTAFVKRK